jgi:uncharacterized protein (DUF433 family)
VGIVSGCDYCVHNAACQFVPVAAEVIPRRPPIAALPVMAGVAGGFRTVSPVRYHPAVPLLTDRITVDSDQCGGRPCVRGMRIRVTDVLDLLAAGLSREQVLDELPDLEIADIDACLRYASRRLDHPVLAA